MSIYLFIYLFIRSQTKRHWRDCIVQCVLQCFTVFCNVFIYSLQGGGLQCVAVCLERLCFAFVVGTVALYYVVGSCFKSSCFNTLQHTATHCNTLQHTAAHCSTLQHTATHCSTLQHTATHCNNTLQHTATHGLQVENEVETESYVISYAYRLGASFVSEYEVATITTGSLRT